MLTSLSDGVSVTLLEAMAAGKPVVATDVCGNSEVVAHDKTGTLVPRGDASKLVMVVDLLLSNATYTQRQYGQPGRQRLLDRLTANRMHADYARPYEPLTANPQAR